MSNNLSQPPSIFGDGYAYAYMQYPPPPSPASQFKVVLGVGQAHGGFFWNRPIYVVTTGPGMLPCDAVGVTSRHAGSGPKS